MTPFFFAIFGFTVYSVSGLSRLLENITQELLEGIQCPQCCLPTVKSGDGFYDHSIGNFSFVDILRHHYDILQEDVDLYDARLLLSSPAFIPTQTEFACTIIQNVLSARDAKRMILELSISDPSIPFYVLRKISKLIRYDSEYYKSPPTHTLFIQQPYNASFVSGYQFNLLFQKTNNQTYALIFSMYGIEFESKDEGIHKRFLNCSMDGRKARLRRQPKSRESLSSPSEEMPHFVEIYNQIEEKVDREFERHIKEHTLLRLQRSLCMT